MQSLFVVMITVSVYVIGSGGKWSFSRNRYILRKNIIEFDSLYVLEFIPDGSSDIYEIKGGAPPRG